MARGYAQSVTNDPNHPFVLPSKGKGVKIGTWIMEAVALLNEQKAEILQAYGHLAPIAMESLQKGTLIFPSPISQVKPVLFFGYGGRVGFDVNKMEDASYGMYTPRGDYRKDDGATFVNKNGGTHNYTLVPRREVASTERQDMYAVKGVLVSLVWIAMSNTEKKLVVRIEPFTMSKKVWENMPGVEPEKDAITAAVEAGEPKEEKAPLAQPLPVPPQATVDVNTLAVSITTAILAALAPKV